MSAILDAGALVAVDRRDRRTGAMLRVLQRQATPVRTSGAVVAQAWRNGTRQANLARLLAGVDVRPLDHRAGRSVGELLGTTGRSDVVDGHVTVLMEPGDTVLTGDQGDLHPLIEARGVDVTVADC